jgi:hypothetical protein
MSRRSLNFLRLISLVDGLLLAFLLYASLSGAHEAVTILGPTHGLLFLLLVVSLGLIARAGHISWRFVIGVIVLGPLLSIPGLELYRRRQRR